MNTAVITGANAGIGFATARYVAGHRGWHVVLACRDIGKAETAVRRIRSDHPGSSVDAAPLDLLSLQSVRNFPAAFDKLCLPPLRALVLNAGGINMGAKALEFSSDGFEHVFQLNFLGHFLLCNLLLEKVRPSGRIIFVSSDLHDPAATKMGRFAPPIYGPVEDAARARGIFAVARPLSRYATAKMFAMMAAREFDRRLNSDGPSGIAVNSWSPGVVPTTQAGRSMPAIQRAIMTSAPFVRFMGSHISTEEEAARALGGLILEPGFEGVSGRYFDGNREIPSSRDSRDQSKAEAVWEEANALTSPASLTVAPFGNRNYAT